VARRHPDWFLRRPSGRPAVGNVNPPWGGEVWVLDTTRPDVLSHLRDLATTLAAMGWRYLKLDFTYAPSLDGEWHDPSLTPAQRVRQAYDAVRAGAGDETFLLGCGAPLGPCIGVVDGMRIGPDVAPTWEPASTLPGYGDTAPAAVNAWRNTLARSFMHRRLWLNDPDCLMLRTSGTKLTEVQVRAWADAVAVSGGMAIVSDDLSILGAAAAELLDDVLAVGRAVDDAAVARAAPACPDLMDRWTPTTLTGGGFTLTGDPVAGRAARTI
jgi:alpha-galactosidase